MAIDLLRLKPHKVSRYITYIYGAPKTGKTTLVTQMEGTITELTEALQKREIELVAMKKRKAFNF